MTLAIAHRLLHRSPNGTGHYSSHGYEFRTKAYGCRILFWSGLDAFVVSHTDLQKERLTLAQFYTYGVSNHAQP